MAWVIGIGLFAVVPIVAGFLIHAAGGGGSNATEVGSRNTGRQGRARTVSRHTVTQDHEVPAEQLRTGERTT
jgi:hypothetical protein